MQQRRGVADVGGRADVGGDGHVERLLHPLAGLLLGQRHDLNPRPARGDATPCVFFFRDRVKTAAHSAAKFGTDNFIEAVS